MRNLAVALSSKKKASYFPSSCLLQRAQSAWKLRTLYLRGLWALLILCKRSQLLWGHVVVAMAWPEDRQHFTHFSPSSVNLLRVFPEPGRCVGDDKNVPLKTEHSAFGSQHFDQLSTTEHCLKEPLWLEGEQPWSVNISWPLNKLNSRLYPRTSDLPSHGLLSSLQYQIWDSHL